MQKGQSLMFILIGIVILGILAGGAFYFGRTIALKSRPSEIIANPPLPLPSASPKNFEVRVKDNTISFLKIDSKVYLKYQGKIYDQDKNFEPQIIVLQNPDSYTWHGILDTDTSYTGNEIFSFKVAPDNESFILIMRWDYLGSGTSKPKAGEKSYGIFYYDSSKPEFKVSNDLSFAPTSNSKYIVSKIDQFSQDGKYVSLNMFQCWNCDGHQPEKLLYNLKTGESKRIGKVSYFVWKDNGAYEYKDYLELQCKTSVPGPCSEDPTNLPLKTGQF